MRKAPAKSADAFIEGAEKDRPGQNATQPTEAMGLDERIKRRSAGRKYNLISLNGTEEQAKLLTYAAEQEHLSKNQLIRKYVFDVLEEHYGDQLPIND